MTFPERRPRIPKGVIPIDEKERRITEREMWAALESPKTKLELRIRVARKPRLYHLDHKFEIVEVIFDEVREYRYSREENEEEIREFALFALLWGRKVKLEKERKKLRLRLPFFRKDHSTNEPKPQRHLRYQGPQTHFRF